MRSTWKGCTRTRRWNVSLPAFFTMYLLAAMRAASSASLVICSCSQLQCATSAWSAQGTLPAAPADAKQWLAHRTAASPRHQLIFTAEGQTALRDSIPGLHAPVVASASTVLHKTNASRVWARGARTEPPMHQTWVIICPPHKVHAERVGVHCCPLGAHIIDTNLRVWHTTAVPRLRVRLVLDLPVAPGRPCMSSTHIQRLQERTPPCCTSNLPTVKLPKPSVSNRRVVRELTASHDGELCVISVCGQKLLQGGYQDAHLL